MLNNKYIIFAIHSHRGVIHSFIVNSYYTVAFHSSSYISSFSNIMSDRLITYKTKKLLFT